MTADTDEPILPLKYRHVIVAQALYNWYLHRKDDINRFRAVKGEYTELMTRMTNDAGIGMKDKPRFVARRGYDGSSWRRGGRGRRRYQTGSEWDDMKI